MIDKIKQERHQRWTATLSDTPVLAELERMCGANRTSLVQSVVDGKVDPYYTAFMEGRRSIWLDIVDCLTPPVDVKQHVDEEDYIEE